jgi:hypothetical protein
MSADAPKVDKNIFTRRNEQFEQFETKLLLQHLNLARERGLSHSKPLFFPDG